MHFLTIILVWTTSEATFHIGDKGNKLMSQATVNRELICCSGTCVIYKPCPVHGIGWLFFPVSHLIGQEQTSCKGYIKDALNPTMYPWWSIVAAVAINRMGEVGDYPQASMIYRTFMKMKIVLKKYVEYTVLCFIFTVLFLYDIWLLEAWLNIKILMHNLDIDISSFVQTKQLGLAIKTLELVVMNVGKEFWRIIS